MKFAGLIAIAVLLSGCITVKADVAEVRANTAAEDSAVARIKVTSREKFATHPNVTALGTVEGVCGRPSKFSGEESGGQGFRHAAYEKYGDKVDGIVGVTGWFVVSPAASAVMEPGDDEGHFQCRGTAVHFES
jgi:hypothetical protein